jgi:plasmid stabilization system protein ParE
MAGVEDWLTQAGAGARASRRLEHIIAAVLGLADHPCLHPQRERGRREFSVEGHRVVYRVTPDTGRSATAGDVRIVRVFGPGQSREP